MLGSSLTLLSAAAAALSVLSSRCEAAPFTAADHKTSNIDGLSRNAPHQQVLLEAVFSEMNPLGAHAEKERSWHASYHNYEEIEEHLNGLATRFPTTTTYFTLGSTYENRSISALRLSLPDDPEDSSRVSAKTAADLSPSKKPGVLLVAGSHAREWISTASTIYFAEKLLSLAQRHQDTPGPEPTPQPDPEPEPEPEPEPPATALSSLRSLPSYVFDLAQDLLLRLHSQRGEASHHRHQQKKQRKGHGHRRRRSGRRPQHHPSPLTPAQAHALLAAFDVTIVPLSNPDGYAYTHKPQKHGGDRLWRKNRQRTQEGGGWAGQGEDECVGIDVTRNWDYDFRAGDKCSESYAGSEAFEALETRALADYMLDEANNIKAFVDLHSYGQHIMYPFASSCDEPLPDEEDLAEVALGSAKALRDLHKSSFSTGRICELLFSNWGSSIDWAYGSAAKMKWSFAVELRDAGTYGFLLKPSEIVPSGEELTSMLAYMLQFIAKKEK